MVWPGIIQYNIGPLIPRSHPPEEDLVFTEHKVTKNSVNSPRTIFYSCYSDLYLLVIYFCEEIKNIYYIY